jgi:hypothetical protein
MAKEVIDFLARKKAKEEWQKANINDIPKEDLPKKTTEKTIGSILSSISGEVNEKEPEKTIGSILSKISGKLEGKQKDFLTLFANMLQIEQLPSSPSTDVTEETQVEDYTKDQCIKHLLESNYLDWNKNASFYKAVVRRFRALGDFENK